MAVKVCEVVLQIYHVAPPNPSFIQQRRIQAFVHSPAFTTNCHDLIYALEKTTAKLPEVTCLVCEKFVESVGSATADIRISNTADAYTISELLIRVYSQSKNQTLQSRCLDVVDHMAQLGTYGLDKALQQFER